jgi:hypothetical protein
MNLRVPYNCGNFFTIGVTIGRWRTVLLQLTGYMGVKLDEFYLLEYNAP